MKKLITTIFALTLLFGGTFIHVHDENCGYDSQAKTGCIYEEVEPFKHEGPKG
ncbi:hypothetical protein NMU03_07850 [Allocoprobacillus halotolerans]|uniref:Uncharacterized protein n=1 Tax=Allocoprobacillus halotolerans TaxID=2944914 RepID=A0ABY5I9P8_9FIRM|nr:hypothetical protein [Allocoprobacillus halotolerans]UTY40665.1 hypothetical protein NMU03_07850 [Allocoprobacillus halotolerans]